ncbi:hypothetical protein, partial [Citrobacter braakii]|uniref:hypothetical protein n=1 Tax=Citrobacter braakii TaxID=57706 RepID=UPI00156238AC
RWLSAAKPTELPEWSIRAVPVPDSSDRVEKPDAPASRNGTKAPILVFLPGIMGSHLAADDSRVWLNPLGLARGALSRITMDNPKVSEDGLVGMAYGKLVEQLGKTHEVELFPYDWRQPIQTLGEQFASRLAALLKN